MSGIIPASSWLTARRVRIHGLLLAGCLWTVYAVDMSTPGSLDRNGIVKGADFLHFYTLGTLAHHGHGDLLYDMRAQSALLQKLVPEASGYSYVPLYGPQVSLLFSPFARLPYGWALAAWLSLNILLYAFCCYAVWRTCPSLEGRLWTVLILALAFPAFFHLLLWGQTAGLALLCFTLGYLALRGHQPFLAGLAIGSLIFKPQLGLAAALVFVVTAEWKVVTGAILAALAQLAAAGLHYGMAVMQNYLRALAHIRDVLALLEPRLYQTHSLRSFWSLLLPWPHFAFGLYLASAVAVLIITLQCWRNQAALEIRYSSLLLATVLVAPHLTVYDLLILAPAFLFLGDWAIQRQARSASAVQTLLYLSYPLFLAGPLARVTRLQLSVLAITALLWICWQISCECGVARSEGRKAKTAG